MCYFMYIDGRKSVITNVTPTFVIYLFMSLLSHYFLSSYPGNMKSDDSQGIWVVGGHAGNHGIKGFIAHAHLYRYSALTVDQNFKSLSNEEKSLKTIGLESSTSNCLLWRRYVKRNLLQLPSIFGTTHQLWDLYRLRHPQFCFSYDDPRFQGTKDSTILKKTLRKMYEKQGVRLFSVKEFRGWLHKELMKALLKASLKSNLVSRLFEVAGCLGNTASIHVAATMATYGVRHPVDIHRGNMLHLMGGLQNGPLSQAALGYRHLIGWHEISVDEDVALGYMRQVAMVTNKILDDETHDVLVSVL